jgi:hypothetical protein
MKYAMPREFYIVKGARKVTHKHSDAVAYVYTDKRGKPCAQIFYGKQSKPIKHFSFRSEAEREKTVAGYFRSRAETLQRGVARLQERKAFQHKVQVGDIFRTCWGYDQTNVEFFQVTKLVGAKLCELREIGCALNSKGPGYDEVVAQTDAFVEGERGQPSRHLIQDGYIKIDNVRKAWPWGERDKVTGTVIGKPVYQTAPGWGH